ncbi:Reticulocyte-binding protein 2-like 11, partial [Homarus americanus]
MDNDSIHLADSDMLERMGVPDPPPPSLAAGPTFTLPTSESFTQALNAHTLKTDMRNPAPEQSNRLLEEILQSKPHSGTPGAQCDMTNLVNMATNEISNQDEILAHEKMKRVPMTTKKTRGTCQVIFKGDSFESSSSYKEVVKGADSGHGENCESHFEEMEYESTVDPCESAVNPLALDTPKPLKKLGFCQSKQKNLLQPIPSGRTTRTKQKELQLSTRGDITDNMVSTADQPHPIPKPRLTRTKQKEVLPLLDTIDESEGQLLPPMDFPKPRMTRTKTKAKEQTNKFENVEYDSQSSVEEGYNTHEKAVAQPSEEIPMSRSTRTKKKVIEVISLTDTPVKNDINKSVDNESQKPRTTRTKKRMFDELGVDQPTRSTRTKCKKMEEQPEKESVASEKLGLCLFLTEPEDEKDGKSSQVVQKSPLVRSVPSVTSMKPSQSATSYTSENTVMAATSTQNTEIGPVRRIIDLRQGLSNVFYCTPEGDTRDDPCKTFSTNICWVTHSPAHVTRHARVRHAKTPDSQRVRIKPPARTPPATCTSDKVIRPKKILLSSSSSTHGSSRDTPKTFSRSRLMLTSSSSKFGDPNEAKYPTNIVTGITSFIKIQPAKPSLEEKRQTGLQKKRDREDETIKKKEELLKLKAEGQKRRNEERMKRVQEAREERERKAIEAKKQQDRDKKNREERLREQQQQHRKQQLLAKRRAEEARVKKIKEQVGLSSNLG